MKISTNSTRRTQSTQWLRHLVATGAMLGTLGCRQAEAPEPTVPETGSGAVVAPLETAQPPAPAATEDLTLMSRPGRLTINGAASGRVFLDGTQVAEAIPAPGLEVAPGRHNVQALLDDGRELTPPAATLLREGSSISLYVRPQNRADRPLEDLDRIVLVEGTLAEPPPSEGSGEAAAQTGLWSGSDRVAIDTNEGSAATPGEGSAEAPTEGSSGDEGNAVAAPPTAVVAAGDGSSPAPESPEGSGAESADAGWAELIVNSSPSGVLYIDGRRSPWRTPVRIRLPLRTYSVQVLYDDGSLSRHLEPPISVEAARQVDFAGPDFLTIR